MSTQYDPACDVCGTDSFHLEVPVYVRERWAFQARSANLNALFAMLNGAPRHADDMKAIKWEEWYKSGNINKVRPLDRSKTHS